MKEQDVRHRVRPFVDDPDRIEGAGIADEGQQLRNRAEERPTVVAD
jgi:hypothetical protein